MIKEFFVFLTILPMVCVTGSANATLPIPPEQALVQKMTKTIGLSVYTIFTVNTVKGKETDTPLGSSVAVSTNALVSNCHVALAYNIIKVKVGDQMKDATVTYQDSDNDICIINVTDGALVPAHIIPSQEIKIGDAVFAIGSPDGINKTISKGTINNKLKEEKINLLQTDVTILAGSNGGGLFDLNGNLIGILTEGIAQGANINFAIPSEVIMNAPLPALQKSDDKNTAHDKNNK